MLKASAPPTSRLITANFRLSTPAPGRRSRSPTSTPERTSTQASRREKSAFDLAIVKPSSSPTVGTSRLHVRLAESDRQVARVVREIHVWSVYHDGSARETPRMGQASPQTQDELEGSRSCGFSRDQPDSSPKPRAPQGGSDYPPASAVDPTAPDVSVRSDRPGDMDMVTSRRAMLRSRPDGAPSGSINHWVMTPLRIA
jgi:hypothetical protein